MAAARSQAPSDRVPLAFEKRIMACLAGREIPDAWTAWSAFLWRALAPCCALMIVTGVGASALTPDTVDLAAQLDAVLLADLDTSAVYAP